ncbi:GTP cyclohydrolase II [Amycolatopsis sp. NPDC059021]|uniref:GTP cyclohydrolase II n=1 Tax=Amycolatopsis sp. NPDC059021 TaxID=3346704 RepID=UPI00366C2164
MVLGEKEWENGRPYPPGEVAPHAGAFGRARVRTCVDLPLTWQSPEMAETQILTFHGLADGGEHFALRVNGGAGDGPCLVRIHSECLTGDLFGSGRCDCGQQLSEALRMMRDEGGVLIYLRQEGRGIGLYNKLDAYALQDCGLDTFEANLELRLPADQRDYTVAAEMLRAMDIRTIRLLSNNPCKREQVENAGISVAEVIPTGVYLNSLNWRYLAAKVTKASHTIELD